MIYLYSGQDRKNKIQYLEKNFKNYEVVFLSGSANSRELLFGYVQSIDLWGTKKIIFAEDFLSMDILSDQDLSVLEKSETVFIFSEDKMTVADLKPYKKYVKDVLKFELKEVKKNNSFNVFGIADAFADKNKISAWALYLDSLEKDISPEAVLGVLFWKVKTLYVNGSRKFSKDELKKISVDIVDLYNHSHGGSVDIKVGTEQLILKSLS
jgi:hypothetical protein